MEASKENTTNIPAGSHFKQEHIRIPTLLSRSPLLAFSALLSKPPLFSDLCFFSFLIFPVLSIFQKPLKLLILSIRTTPFSSHSALEKSPSALEPPNTFISPISQGGQLPSHYFITPCPPRLHMDSRWVAINPKNGPNRT